MEWRWGLVASGDAFSPAHHLARALRAILPHSGTTSRRWALAASSDSSAIRRVPTPRRRVLLRTQQWLIFQASPSSSQSSAPI